MILVNIALDQTLQHQQLIVMKVIIAQLALTFQSKKRQLLVISLLQDNLKKQNVI